jgi:hypothetical protein
MLGSAEGVLSRPLRKREDLGGETAARAAETERPAVGAAAPRLEGEREEPARGAGLTLALGRCQ